MLHCLWNIVDVDHLQKIKIRVNAIRALRHWHLIRNWIKHSWNNDVNLWKNMKWFPKIWFVFNFSRILSAWKFRLSCVNLLFSYFFSPSLSPSLPFSIPSSLPSSFPSAHYFSISFWQGVWPGENLLVQVDVEWLCVCVCMWVFTRLSDWKAPQLNLDLRNF